MWCIYIYAHTLVYVLEIWNVRELQKMGVAIITCYDMINWDFKWITNKTFCPWSVKLLLVKLTFDTTNTWLKFQLPGSKFHAVLFIRRARKYKGPQRLWPPWLIKQFNFFIFSAHGPCCTDVESLKQIYFCSHLDIYIYIYIVLSTIRDSKSEISQKT